MNLLLSPHSDQVHKEGRSCAGVTQWHEELKHAEKVNLKCMPLN